MGKVGKVGGSAKRGEVVMGEGGRKRWRVFHDAKKKLLWDKNHKKKFWPKVVGKVGEVGRGEVVMGKNRKLF